MEPWFPSFSISAIHFVYSMDPLVTFRYFRDMSLSSILLSGRKTANVTCQLMICQMSRTQRPTLNWLQVLPFLVVLVANLGVASYIESILLCTFCFHSGPHALWSTEGKAAEQIFRFTFPH